MFVENDLQQTSLSAKERRNIVAGLLTLSLLLSPAASAKTKERLRRKSARVPKPVATTSKPTATMLSTITTKDVEHEASTVAGAYIRSLSTLDGSRPIGYPITIVITHSIPEDAASEVETKSFASFTLAEQWLKLRATDGFPQRSLGRLDSCQNGICSYSFSDGIQHSNVYLQSLQYKIINGTVVFTQLDLLDGD
jgi:hypothetical protein